MKELKLIELLKTFSKREIKEFDAFIRSPYFSRGRNLLPLYSHIKSTYPVFSTDELGSEKIFKALYPDKPFSSKNSGILIRKLFSELGAAAEEFLMVQSLREDRGKQYLFKLSEFARRDLPNHFGKAYVSAEEYAGNNTLTIAKKNKYLYEILEQRIDYYVDKGHRGIFNTFMEEANTRLLNFFYFSLVINLQAQNTETISSGKSKKNSFTGNFMNNFDFDNFARSSGSPSIEIYNLYLLEIENKHDINTVLKLFGLLEEHKDLFIKEELHDLYLGLAAMCTGLATRKKGKMNFKRLLLNIYKSSALNDVMLNPRNGKIDILKFRNVLDAALSCSEHEYARQFVDTYLPCLPKETIKNTKALSYAMLEYSMGNYQQALDMLSGVSQSKFTFIHDLKFLQLKCYYDLNYYDNADSLISSYRQYIKYSTSTSNKHKEYILNFIKQYKMLWEIRITGSKILYERLKLDLAGAEYSWIFKKLAKLKKK